MTLSKTRQISLVQAAVGIALGSLALITVPSVVRAQDAQAAAEEGGLEEVTVTARFRSEPLQQTPLAITALSSDALEMRSFSGAQDVAQMVPNARFAQAQAAYGKAMTAYIRGVGQYDFNPAFEPGVGIYVDDTYHATLTGSLFDLLDLDHVEVLRGPQGTLFGRGSIGGAMRLVTKKPTGDGSGYLSATGGSLNRLDVRGGFDIPLIADKVFMRVAAASKRREGYMKVLDFACANPSQAGSLPVVASNRQSNCVIDHYGDEDTTGARVALRALVSDKLTLDWSADYADDNAGPAADKLIAVVGPVGPFSAWSNNTIAPKYGVQYDSRFVTSDYRTTYATYADPITGYSVEKRDGVRQWGTSASADYRFDERLSAKLILTYSDFKSFLAHDSDGSPLNLQTVNGIGTFSGGTAELRFSGTTLSDRLDWTAGLFYYDSESGNAQAVSIPALNPAGFTANSDHKVDNQNESVYLHSVYRSTDKLTFTAGLRYSKDDRTFHFNDIASSVGQRDMDASGSNVDYKVGTDYKFTDKLMGYASVSTGYKPKAFNPRPFQASQLVPVDGEELTAYELGFKSDLFDNRLRMNTAAFYSDYKKRILSRPGVECRKQPDGTVISVPSTTPGSVTDPEGSGVFCLTTSRTNYVNIPGKVKGLELELDARPIENLSITAGGGWTDFTASNLSGDAMPVYVPKYNANVGLSYTSNLAGGGKVVPHAEYYYQSEICYTLSAATATNPVASCAPGYFQVNARVDFTTSSGAWTVGAGVTNLTGEDYYYNIFDLSAFGQPTIEGTPSRPREWFISVSRQFN